MRVPAARYTPPGGLVRLSARPHDEAAEVSVADNGIGIEPQMLPHVFEMFSQADPKVGTSVGGLGIGLALVRAIVQMHGGTVKGSSEGPGKGACFTVRLPLVKDVAPLAEAAAAAPVGPLRVLVVDDNHDAAESTAVLLELFGHQVAVVHDGYTAITAARDFDPHVILMDLGLPRLSGLEATRRIRQQLPERNIRIVALTGKAHDADRAAARDAGCDAHLVKPVEPQALQRVLSERPRDRG